MLLGFALAPALAAVAYRLGMLSRSGLLAATLLGAIVYGLGGLPWALLLILFFASSSLLSRAFAGRKARVVRHFSKGGRRDWGQVAANGGVGALLILAALALDLNLGRLWPAYAASLAAVTADTWATELGVLSRRPPRLLTTGRQVEPGTSGAVSRVGNLAALAGALLIALAAHFLYPGSASFAIILLVTLAGFLGGLADSLLGATVQAIYYCPQHEKETEQHPLHYCGAETRFHRGWPWLDNDWVNFISALVAALLALSLLPLVG